MKQIFLNNKFLLTLIISLAFILRVNQFGSSPPSLNWDEASIGYNAYSILHTGKDEWGRFMPLSFEAFGDYKLPVYIYAAVPSVAIIGLTELAVRLPSLIAGVLSVLLIYLIAKQLLCHERVALLSSLLLAISPVGIFLSRMAVEANLAFCLFLVGVYLLLVGLKKPKFWILSALFFGLTLFTYNSARVFAPIFLLGAAIIFRDRIWKNKTRLIIPAIIVGIFFVVASFLAVSQDSSARYYWVKIVDQGAIAYLDNARNTSALPTVASKLVYNRYVYFSENFIKNYLTHFSFEYLFLQGGSNHQFSVPDTGVLYLIALPFLIFGIVKTLKKREWGMLALVWLLAAPIPSAITREAPHVLRSIFMLGSMEILVAEGMYQSWLSLRNKRWITLAVAGVMICLVVNLSTYLYQYFIVYPRVNSQSWQYGMKQAVEAVNAHPDYLTQSDKQIYFTKSAGEAHIFYLFYSLYDPARYQNNPTLVRYYKTQWTWVDKLDKINFINDWEMQQKLKGVRNALVVTTPGNYPRGAKVIDSVYFLDGSKAYDIVEI